MSINILNYDVLLKIFDYLSDKDKICLCSANTDLRQFIYNIKFCGIYNYNKIKDLSYYSRFKYIKYKANNKHIPNSITLSAQRQVREKVLPSRLTHLTFVDDFNQSIKGCIPNSVTLSSCVFNEHSLRVFKNSPEEQVREKVLPSRLTHLTFGREFNQSIKGCIPNSVTHLTLSKSLYEKNIKYINRNIIVNGY
ncbi:FNIp repeat-containing protein [Saudi moumouvirus]|nr:FNIp repeat-containing protein [Saudi moumouvirus]